MGKILFAVLPIALFVGALCVITGCSDKSVILRTPYGIIDTTTSGTTELDISPLFPPPPPPNLTVRLDDVPPAKDYTPTLEK